MEGNKFLIDDTSGFNPIWHSIEKGMIKISDLNIFLDHSNIQPCMTDFILQEVVSIYSKTPDHLMFKQNQFSSADTASSGTSNLPINTCWLTSNGTTTTFENRDSLEVKVFNTGDQTSQKTFLQSLNYQSKLSMPDISNISLAYELSSSGNNAAILANDNNLRKQAELLSILIYGSSSFLAGMVLSSIYTDEKATKIYNEWKMVDKRWVPRDLLFKDVLSLERKRNKNKKSFWFNYD